MEHSVERKIAKGFDAYRNTPESISAPVSAFSEEWNFDKSLRVSEF